MSYYRSLFKTLITITTIIINLNALFGLLQQDLIKPVLQVIGGPLEKQLRTHPPVRDENLLARTVQPQHDTLVVGLGIAEPAALLAGARRRVRAEREQRVVAEHAARAGQHLADLLAPLRLLLAAAALEHERPLQVADLEAVVGARLDALLHLQTIRKHEI